MLDKIEASIIVAQNRIKVLNKIDFTIYLPLSIHNFYFVIKKSSELYNYSLSDLLDEVFLSFSSFWFTTITFSSLAKSIIGVNSIFNDEL